MGEPRRHASGGTRQRVRAAAGRVWRNRTSIIEAVGAATLAWIVAAHLLRHPQPFFAPSAALMVLAESRGRRVRQTIEILLGVVAGVLVADVVVRALGSGAGTVLVVLLLTLTLMIAVDASSTLTVQAAVSALYLVVAASPDGPAAPLRFVDALVGGAVALAVSQIVVARDPLGPLVGEARRTFRDLARVLTDICGALQRCDESAARAVLERARQVDDCVDRLRAATTAAGETLRLRVRKRRHLPQIEDVETTTRHLDYAARNIRVLARAGVQLSRRADATPPEICAALDALADAMRCAGEALVTDLSRHGDPQRHLHAADAAALRAVRLGGRLLETRPPLPVVLIIGQIRATAVDLLRSVDGDDMAVLERVDAALDSHTTGAQ